MTLHTVAMAIGYGVLFTGGALFAVMLVGVAAWQAVEWWYRRYTDVKFLREFIQWKRKRYPG